MQKKKLSIFSPHHGQSIGNILGRTALEKEEEKRRSKIEFLKSNIPPQFKSNVVEKLETLNDISLNTLIVLNLLSRQLRGHHKEYSECEDDFKILFNTLESEFGFIPISQEMDAFFVLLGKDYTRSHLWNYHFALFENEGLSHFYFSENIYAFDSYARRIIEIDNATPIFYYGFEISDEDIQLYSKFLSEI